MSINILENEIKQDIELLEALSLNDLNNRFPQGTISNLGSDGSTASDNFELNAEEQKILIGSATSELTGAGVFIGKGFIEEKGLKEGKGKGLKKEIAIGTASKLVNIYYGQ